MQEGSRPDTLASLFAQGTRLPRAEALRVARSILAELAKLHATGVLHRNLHPGCVQFRPDGGVTLSGLELAKEKDDPPRAGGPMSGAIRVMAPEQVLGGAVDERTDIYQAGLIVYRLVAGRPAFEAAGAWALARKIASEDPVAPRLVDATVPQDLSDLIVKALSRDPAGRVASAADFAERLARLSS